MLGGDFPLDSGIFGSLVVTGPAGNPIVPKPDAEHNGRLAVSGEVDLWKGERTTITNHHGDDATAAVIAEQRTLTIIGDADVEDHAYITGAWSESVRLQSECAPVVLGWRVRYVANGFTYCERESDIQTSGPRFGLATKSSLVAATHGVEHVISLVPTPSKSAVRCCRADLKCQSCPPEFIGNPDLPEESLVPGLSVNDAGGYDYDVIIAFDSTNHQVRASVGWGTPGWRIDTVSVPVELWPSAEVELMPCVSMVAEDYGGIRNVLDAAQLPITFEALTREQMADEAIEALLSATSTAGTVTLANAQRCKAAVAKMSAAGDSLAPMPRKAAPAELDAICGFWASEKGECRISTDKITQRLYYEELIGDGSERIHGWLEYMGKEDDCACWEAELVILDEDAGPWYGPSFGEKPEVIGCIKVVLLSSGEARAMGTNIKTLDDANWQPRTFFKPADAAE